MVAIAQSLREQVAWACRILALEGYADLTLGHVSARGPGGEFWIKRKGVALDEVEPEDIVAIDDTDAVLHLDKDVLVIHLASAYASAGRALRCDVAFSNASATRNSVASSNGLPTSCTATGRPPSP